MQRVASSGFGISMRPVIVPHVASGMKMRHPRRLLRRGMIRWRSKWRGDFVSTQTLMAFSSMMLSCVHCAIGAGLAVALTDCRAHRAFHASLTHDAMIKY